MTPMGLHHHDTSFFMIKVIFHDFPMTSRGFQLGPFTVSPYSIHRQERLILPRRVALGSLALAGLSFRSAAAQVRKAESTWNPGGGFEPFTMGKSFFEMEQHHCLDGEINYKWKINYTYQTWRAMEHPPLIWMIFPNLYE